MKLPKDKNGTSIRPGDTLVINHWTWEETSMVYASISQMYYLCQIPSSQLEIVL